jgi:hypothetical protein
MPAPKIPGSQASAGRSPGAAGKECPRHMGRQTVRTPGSEESRRSRSVPSGRTVRIAVDSSACSRAVRAGLQEALQAMTTDRSGSRQVSTCRRYVPAENIPAVWHESLRAVSATQNACRKSEQAGHSVVPQFQGRLAQRPRGERDDDDCQKAFDGHFGNRLEKHQAEGDAEKRGDDEPDRAADVNASPSAATTISATVMETSTATTSTAVTSLQRVRKGGYERKSPGRYREERCSTGATLWPVVPGDNFHDLPGETPPASTAAEIPCLAGCDGT